MSTGSESDNDTLNTTDSNLDHERYDAWMIENSQGVQRTNIALLCETRKLSSTLQRTHSEVKREVFHHKKVSTFRPAPLDVNTSGEVAKTPTTIKSLIDLTSAGTCGSEINTAFSISPIPFAMSRSKQGSTKQDSKSVGVESILREIKKIEQSNDLLLETQEKILASQTVFYGLISDLDKSLSPEHKREYQTSIEEKNIDELSKSTELPKTVQQIEPGASQKDDKKVSCEESKAVLTEGKVYTPSEIFVAKLHLKLNKDDLIELVSNNGFERPSKKQFTKEQLINMLFPHLKEIFG